MVLQGIGKAWSVVLGSWAVAAVAMAQGAGAPDGAADPQASRRLHAFTRLLPAGDPAVPSDDAGLVLLRQRDDRLALQVRVRHLEPGVAHEVLASRPLEGGGVETASLGTITTRKVEPSMPRCFRAVLREPEDPSVEGGGAWFGDARPERHTPGALALFLRGRLADDLHVFFRIWGVEGTVTGARIVFEGGAEVAISLGEDLRGTVKLDPAQIRTLASGQATAEVGTDAGDELIGGIGPCIPGADDARARMGERFAGSGALRLDTGRGDPMPFGLTSLASFVGVNFVVKTAAGVVVLQGTITEVKEFVRRPAPEPAPAAAGAGAVDAELLEPPVEDSRFFELSEPHDASFVRGDVNDDGRVDISDPIEILGHLFRGERAPYCADAGDANDSGSLDMSDPVFLLQALFQGLGSLAAPYPERGFDSSADGLFCSPTQG